MMIAKLFILIISTNATSLRYQRFCEQKQLGNLARLAKTIENLYYVEFSVVSSRKRRHETNIHQNVFHFYQHHHTNLQKIAHDLHYLSLENLEIVKNTVEVMQELINDELLQNGHTIALHRAARDHHRLNRDVVRERITLSLKRVVQDFLSAGHQCNSF